MRAQPGRSKYLVVALHGYGGCGRSLAHALVAGTPRGVEVVVEAPDGPVVPELVGRGRCWFPITSQRTAIGQRASRLAAPVAHLVGGLRARHGVRRSRTCLVGFSQGVAVAVAVLAHTPLCARAVLVCGRVPSVREVAPIADALPVDVLAITGERDRYVRHDEVVADLRTSFLPAPARCLAVAGLGHEFTGEVARLAMAHATE